MRVVIALFGAVVGVLTACSADGSVAGPVATPSNADAGSPSSAPPPPSVPPSAPSGTAAPGTPAPTPAPAQAEPELLLPDMISMPATDIHIELDGATRLLRFEATLANIGVGPVEIVVDESRPCPAEQRFASQRIYLDADADGAHDPRVDRQQVVVPAGCMIDHPTHDHWHFDSSARYVVSAVGSRDPIVSSDKVSFCLRDNVPLYRAAGAQTYGDCERDSVQGITAGWGDIYTSELDGQQLPLPANLADGRYCLTLSANPYHLLRESDGTNNGSRMGVQIIGNTATAAPATGCVPPVLPAS